MSFNTPLVALVLVALAVLATAAPLMDFGNITSTGGEVAPERRERHRHIRNSTSTTTTTTTTGPRNHQRSARTFPHHQGKDQSASQHHHHHHVDHSTGHKTRKRCGHNMCPSFMLVGTPKSASTAVYAYLAQHPDFLPPPSAPYQIDTFDDNFLHQSQKEFYHFYRRPESEDPYYIELYPKWKDVADKVAKNPHLFTGEATPIYFSLDDAPRRIAKLFPNMKLIVTLRDPAARAYSAYKFTRDAQLLDKTKGNLSVSFAEFVDNGIESTQRCKRQYYSNNHTKLNECISREEHYSTVFYMAWYGAHLRNWFKYFDRRNIHIIRSEDIALEGGPEIVMEGVQKFLGLQPFNWTKVGHENWVLGVLKGQEELNFLKVIPHTLDVMHTSYPPIDEVQKRRIHAYFADTNHDLEELIGRLLYWGSD